MGWLVMRRTNPTAGRGPTPWRQRLLGTMITYGYPRLSLDSELDLAERFDVDVLEILPDWASLPDPRTLRTAVADRGLTIHSAHGCWGGRSIRADRVDLGDTDPVDPSPVGGRPEAVRGLAGSGGRNAPGGSSRGSLTAGRCGEPTCQSGLRPARAGGACRGKRCHHLRREHAAGRSSRQPDGRTVRPARASSTTRGSPWRWTPDTPTSRRTSTTETLAAGALLATTHVHDNDGRRDTHDSPGLWNHRLDRLGNRAGSGGLPRVRSCWSVSVSFARILPSSVPISLAILTGCGRRVARIVADNRKPGAVRTVLTVPSPAEGGPG